MGKIVLLDDLTINQIAAGEVIERPASVIKELVENSIDAGAKNVTIDIKNGGISYIRITDDGSGIMPDDMEIAFERHATSKIRKAEDLDNVKSMGFRGEALASIGAIAKVELVSKTGDNDFGYSIYVEGGDITDKHECGAQKGTTITVKELFFNTPVRYKFLKKDFTESGYIEDTITRIALANPGIAIKFINTGKIVIQTNGSGKLEDVIYSIYGKEIYENVLPVDYTFEDYHVTGVIGKPIISRSNRSNQLFFVNRRFIKDKTLTGAAEQGFKGLVTIGKHGFLILNIDMDPKKVDVNVHPTKLEVRFQEEAKVFKAVYHAIKETLLKGDLVSDPVKDYKDITPNDMLKEIKNKDRVEAWGLNKSFANSIENKENKDSGVNEYIKENLGSDVLEKSENDLETANEKKPKYNEFKSAITGLDAETRRKFIDEITNAKSTDELIKKAEEFNKIVEENKKENTVSENEAKYTNESNSEETNDLNNSQSAIDSENSDYLKEKENLNDNAINTNDTENVTLNTTENTNLNDSINETKNINLNDNVNEIKNTDLNDNVNEIKNTDLNNNANENQNIISGDNESTIDSMNKEEKEARDEKSFEEMYKKLFGRDIETAKKEYEVKKAEEAKLYKTEPITDNEISMFEGIDDESVMPYNFVGIAFKTYIILTMNDDLYILDQHAAHERIMFEKVKKNYYSDTDKDSQLMLLPDIINLNNKEMGIFRDNKEMFNRAGFVVDEFGDNTVKLTGVPEFCLNFNTKEIFLETLDEIDTVARTAKQEVENKFLATVACKAAVKAHMALNKEEVDSLMKQLLKLPNPFSCPHGRPTVIKMSKNDIEKKFSRR